MNPSTSGQMVTFIISAITPSTATGAVTFCDRITSLGGALLSGGVAALSKSSLAPQGY
ncbi:MAG: hypothetical protein ABSB35_25025 [Bryobacteraceae bacterium]